MRHFIRPGSKLIARIESFRNWEKNNVIGNSLRYINDGPNLIVLTFVLNWNVYRKHTAWTDPEGGRQKIRTPIPEKSQVTIGPPSVKYVDGYKNTLSGPPPPPPPDGIFWIRALYYSWSIKKHKKTNWLKVKR